MFVPAGCSGINHTPDQPLYKCLYKTYGRIFIRAPTFMEFECMDTYVYALSCAYAGITGFYYGFICAAESTLLLLIMHMHVGLCTNL